MTYIEANDQVKTIENNIKQLGYYDWEEILDFVPDSEQLKNEIARYIEDISNAAKELKNFFK